MKKIQHILLAISLISACSLLSSCNKDEHYHIGVSQSNEDDWRPKMNGEMEREIMFHPEATMEIVSADGDSRKQIEDIRKMYESGVDLLIIAPTDAESVTPAVLDIYNSGIPIIIFDRNINSDSFTAYQGADNVDFGSAAAQLIIKNFPDNPKILEITGIAGSTPAIGRHQGFYDTLKEKALKFELKTVASDWTYDNALKQTLETLKDNKDVDVIYAHNDKMAIAASEAASRLGLDPYIIGTDGAPGIGLKAVKDGIIDATFQFPTEGSRIINTAIAILKGNKYERFAVLPSLAVVTKNNVDIVLQQQDALALETQHLELLKEQLVDYWKEHSKKNTLQIMNIIIVVLIIIIIIVVIRIFWLKRKHHRSLSGEEDS